MSVAARPLLPGGRHARTRPRSGTVRTQHLPLCNEGGGRIVEVVVVRRSRRRGDRKVREGGRGPPGEIGRYRDEVVRGVPCHRRDSRGRCRGTHGAGAVPRPDLRLQGRRPPDARELLRVLPRDRLERRSTHGAGGHLRRHRLGRDLRPPRKEGRRLRHPVPQGPRLGNSGASDDDRPRRQHSLRLRGGYVRRLSRHRQGVVRRSGLPREGQARGRQFHQLVPRPRPDHLLLLVVPPGHRQASHGGGGSLLGPHGQLRGRPRRILRQEDGTAGGEAHRRHQRKRHPSSILRQG
mmetsp:Transcript_44661/g.136231  ORF Transcript_44661/g.136231 Transcript_44661/m.136231 type:complete len:293 (-) Transcript_44661:1234-2112(-)